MVKLKEEGENWEGKQALFCNYKDRQKCYFSGFGCFSPHIADSLRVQLQYCPWPEPFGEAATASHQPALGKVLTTHSLKLWFNREKLKELKKT